MWNGIQGNVNVLSVCSDLRCSSFKSKVNDFPHKQVAQLYVTAEPARTNEIIVSTLQPSQRLTPIAGHVGVCADDIGRQYILVQASPRDLLHNDYAHCHELG